MRFNSLVLGHNRKVQIMIKFKKSEIGDALFKNNTP